MNGYLAPYEASVNELLQIIDDAKPGERWAASYALSKKDVILPKDIIDHLFSSSDVDTKRSVVNMIGNHKFGIEYKSIVLDALIDKNEVLRRTACGAARELKLLEANDAIISMLKSPSLAAKTDALRALEIVWREDNFDIIFDVYSSETDIELTKRAAWVLYCNANKSNWRKMFDYWKIDNINRHRLWSCKIAGKYGSLENIDDLNTLCNDKDGHVRKAAKNAIAQISISDEDKYKI